MRILIIILTLLSFNTLSQSIKSTYLINYKSKTSTYVLHLRDNNKYEVLDFIKNSETTLPISMVDTGTYSLKNKFSLNTITFKSEKKRKFSLNDITYFIHKDKLYEKPIDPVLKKPYKAIITLDTVYQKTIHFEVVLKNKEIKKEFAKVFFFNNITKYEPSYLSLIEESFCGPGCYNPIGSSWNGDTTYNKLINDCSTMIHETTHNYNHGVTDYNWKTKCWSERALIEPGIGILYEETPIFHSELFISIVPKEAPKKIFRYELYVGKNAFPSANLSGIYGLMNEFSAYRNGTRSGIEGANTAIKLKDTDKIAIFQKQAIGEYFAYYEFRLFIAWYLEYAERNKPEIYKKIMANTNFRIAYTLLDDGFSSDIKELESLVKKYPVYSYEYNEKEYAQYVKDLLVNHEKTLTKFRIEGVNKQNYKEKLK